MTIRPFLSGRPFDPEMIQGMSVALKSVCETLSLELADGPETRMWPKRSSSLLNAACVTLLGAQRWR
jgi:hypothetical protein